MTDIHRHMHAYMHVYTLSYTCTYDTRANTYIHSQSMHAHTHLSAN